MSGTIDSNKIPARMSLDFRRKRLKFLRQTPDACLLIPRRQRQLGDAGNRLPIQGPIEEAQPDLGADGW